MKIKITAEPSVLHGFPLNDPDDGQGYTLRFDGGKSYEVDANLGGYFRAQGWAEVADEDDELSEPFNLREATDEDAERHEREVLDPARERSTVQTVRYIGTG